MRKQRVREIPEQAAQCLTCACLNEDNPAGRELLFAADAITAAGVIAAVFIARAEEQAAIVHLARQAIQQQRDWCHRNGPYRPHRCSPLQRSTGR